MTGIKTTKDRILNGNRQQLQNFPQQQQQQQPGTPNPDTVFKAELKKNVKAMYAATPEAFEFFLFYLFRESNIIGMLFDAPPDVVVRHHFAVEGLRRAYNSLVEIIGEADQVQ